MSETELKYEPVLQRNRAVLEKKLGSDTPSEVIDALYSACRYESDWGWLQSECLKRLSSPVISVRWAAAVCLGDLAWFRHFPIEKDIVIPALENASRDHEIAGPASDSLELVREFA